MGLPELAHADARHVAGDLGIEIIEQRGVPWLVCSSGDTLLYCWSESEQVRQARIWEGIAQVLLWRLGVAWTASQARELSDWLRTASISLR